MIWPFAKKNHLLRSTFLMLDRTEQPIFHTWEPDDPQSWRPSMKVWANGPGQDRHLAILPEKEIRIVKVKKSDLPELKIRIDPCQDRHLLATLLERQIKNHTYHLFMKLINELFICLFVYPVLQITAPASFECNCWSAHKHWMHATAWSWQGSML